MQAFHLINDADTSSFGRKRSKVGIAWRISVCVLAMGVGVSFCPICAWADTPALRPPDDAATIISLVESFNKTRDKQKREQYVDQLNGYRQHWEVMFVAACDRRLSLFKNEVLIPILAAPGQSVVPKSVELLTWNPDSDLGTAVRVTREVGDDAIPGLMEQYKASAPILVRRYVAISIKVIVARKNSNKPNATEVVQWALRVVSSEDEAVVESSIRVMRSLFTEKNAGKIEAVVKAKLKDARPMVRMAAIAILAEVRPKAEYVKEYVVASALKSQDVVERIANIGICVRLSECDDVLDVLYECSFDKEGQVRNAAERALRELGPKTLPLADKMLKKLQEGDVDSLPAILAVLKHSKANWDAIEDSLAKLLSTENVRARCSALNFLASHSLRDDTIRRMVDLLDASDKQVRALAVRSLHPFIEKKVVREAIARRRDRETDKSVKQLLDMFMSEVKQAENAKKPAG